MKEFLKKYKYDVIIVSFLITLFVVLSFCFPYCFRRLWFSIINLFESFKFYFLSIFKVESDIPQNFYDLVNNQNGLSAVYDLKYEFYLLPKDFYTFQEWFKTQFIMLINFDYFKSSISFLSWLVDNLNIIALFFMLLVCFFMIIDLVYFSQKNSKSLGDTKGLIKLDDFFEKHLKKYKMFFQNLHNSWAGKVIYKKVFLITFLFYTLALSLCIETFSFLLVIFSAFRFDLIYPCVYSIFYTLFPALTYIPGFVWFSAFILVFDYYRKKIALNKLTHLEHLNENFVDGLGVMTLISGEPGTGKTTLMVDMGLTSEKLYRFRLFDILKKFESYFPRFDFPKFRAYIDSLNTSCNLNRVQVLNLIDKSLLDNTFPIKYDGNRFGLYHYDNLKDYSFDEVLKIYASAYIFYTSTKPLMFSNLPIRCSYAVLSSSYLKSFTYRFFSEDLSNYYHYSFMDHIIDYNNMRLGSKTYTPDFYMECCTVLITELGKERGNQFDTRGLRKDDDSANLLNDFFNQYCKLTRHFSTIDHYPFFRLIADEQRVNSLNLDLVDLCENLVTIKKDYKDGYVIPLFIFDSIICDFVISLRNRFYEKYFSTRNYLSVFYQFMNYLTLPFVRYYEKWKNFSHFKQLDLVLGNSTSLDSKDVPVVKYYLSDKKVYSNRFATDCYSSYFFSALEKAKVNQENSRVYHDVTMSHEELESQHSYMISNLDRYDSFVDHRNDDK